MELDLQRNCLNQSAPCAVYYHIAPTSQTLSDASQKSIASQLLRNAFLAFFQVPLEEKLIKRTPLGKPYYDTAEKRYFNITHCKNAVAVAVARVPVGIDAEGMRLVKRHTVRKCCSEKEQEYIFQAHPSDPDRVLELPQKEARRFLSLWTLKESYVKMTGNGMKTPFHTVCFDLFEFHPIVEGMLWHADFGKHQSYLYTLPNITIALTLQFPGELCGVRWFSFGSGEKPIASDKREDGHYPLGS